MNRLNWSAILNGALAGLLIAGPAGIIGTLLARGDSGAAVVVLFVLIAMLGFACAGFGAARLVHENQLLHASIAPVVSFLALQFVLHLRRLFAGEPIDLWRYPVFALLASSLGVLGGLLAVRWTASERHGVDS